MKKFKLETKIYLINLEEINERQYYEKIWI